MAQLYVFSLAYIATMGSVSALEPPRIAVIGTGIGGATFTRFLREELEQEPQITMFEKKGSIGGRMMHEDIGNSTVELGASMGKHTHTPYTA